jgi:hypothetical protein
LVEARRATPFAPGWYATLVKGFAVVCARIPELRRAYIPYPLPRLYEHPHSVASVVVDREFAGEHATFLCTMRHPERMPLTTVHDKLRAFQDDPVERHGPLRRVVRHSRLPRPVRRTLVGLGLNWSGRLRADFFGTFAVNSVAGFRIRMLQSMTPITTVLYFGSVARTGELDVQIAFDHRVFDGYTAGRALGELETVLNTEVAAETRRSGRAAA